MRGLQLKLGVALLAAGMLCVYLASRSSGDELRGAYTDSARSVLQEATSSFEARYRASGGRPERRDRLLALAGAHPQLQWASVYLPGGRVPAATVGDPPGARVERELAAQAMRSGQQPDASEWRGAGGNHAELLVTPLGRDGEVTGALAAGYDLRPADAQLERRNERLLLVLGVLLASFIGFTILLLQRGLLRPLQQMRAAARAVGAGDLSTRLRWRRRDELGQLATEFDSMAAHLEDHRGRLEQLAHRDPLTGLANHRRFQELLGEELRRARAVGRPLSVALLDLDEFKRVNESRGHPYGDELLGRAAAGLSTSMRSLGLLARMGGDSFGVILRDVEGHRASVLVERARAAVESAAPLPGLLRCSAGLACFPDHAKGTGALLELASGALSWAKAGGGGRTRRYDPQHVFVVTEEQREDFAALIARPEVLRPVFQPIMSLTSGQAIGYEALARFRGKPGLPPSWWFSQAHRFGLGAALEAEAVRAARAAEHRPPGTFLSVNLSPSALASEQVRDRLAGDLGGIVIEITEEERVLDVRALHRHLDPLRARGARIAVDDAGEGYAGLQQVMSMRADVIKLDRALVADVQGDPAKIALIGSLVHFARSTGASICAEGIETLEELRVLVHLGVSSGQGWAIGRPGPPWGRVNAEAARLCRELHSERAWTSAPRAAAVRGA